MITKFQNEKIFLASKSPRRKQLLIEAGFTFEVIPIEADESFPESLEAEKVPEYIAKKKAEESKKSIPENAILITADCIVLFDNKILEKPKDREEAIDMIKSMSGKNHRVISGVSISKGQKELSFSVTTSVQFGILSQNEIEYYVDTYSPYDKAGSYGIQEWIGHCKVARIEGSYTNVMGLPMYELYLNLIALIEN